MYKRQAYQTVKVSGTPALAPELPRGAVTANLIRTALPGIILFHERIELEIGAAETWEELHARHRLCFCTGWFTRRADGDGMAGAH